MQRFPKLDEMLDFGKAAARVSTPRFHVLNVGIRRQFAKSAGARPGLCRGDEHRAEASASRAGLDVPGFKMRDGHRFAAVGERADRKLQKPDGDGGFILRDKYGGYVW